MTGVTQADRPLRVTTPLGPDAFVLLELTGREAVSEPFRFTLKLAAPRGVPVPFEKLLGQAVSVEIAPDGQPPRYVHGVVSRLTRTGSDLTFTYFTAVLVPKLWLLSLTTTCRVFQQVTVPDVLHQLLGPLRPDLKFQLAEQYEPRDYCVQYNETDLAFASRLMEQEGIAYWFDHAADKTALVVTDGASGFGKMPAGGVLTFDDSDRPREPLRVSTWAVEQALRPSKYSARDFHFELASQALDAEDQLAQQATAGTVEHPLAPPGVEATEEFLYPARVADHFDCVGPQGDDQPDALGKVYDAGHRDARLRAQAASASCVRIDATGHAAVLAPGQKFTLERHPDGDGDYLCLAVEHAARNPGAGRAGDAAEFSYTNRTAAMPAGLPYRTPRRTPRPVIAGAQPATVTGPKGQPVFLDKYGRIKVQFRWDRGDAGSCWVRVAQAWAGPNWGSFFWPRVGHEVVVLFEDGDPDRPVVVGSVYNSDNFPPVALPAESALGGFKSCSMGGDPSTQANLWFFVDTPGHEYIHAHSETSEVRHSQATKYHFAASDQFSINGRLPG